MIVKLWRRLVLIFGLSCLILGAGQPLEGQETPSFTEIIGIRPTKADALREAEHIASVGENWNGPLTPGPDFFRGGEGTANTFAFFFWHNCPRARAYFFTLIVDNFEIAFELENQEGGRLRHEIIVETNVPLVREFTIPQQSRGLHNFSIVAFSKEGECFQPPPGFTLIPRNLVVEVSRSVLVGLEEPPEFTVTRPLSLDSFKAGAAQQQKRSDLNSGIYISLSPDPDYAELRFPPTEVSLKLGERFDYFIYAKNDLYPQIREWAILVFVEALQVPIDPFQSPVVWYESVLLSAGQEIILPASLVAPREPGTYNLVLMMFGEPYRLTTEATLWIPSSASRWRFELRVEAP